MKRFEGKTGKLAVGLLVLLAVLLAALACAGAESAAATYRIQYFETEKATAPAEKVSDMVHGVQTPILGIDELGFKEEGRIFVSWKACLAGEDKWYAKKPDGTKDFVPLEDGKLPAGYELFTFSNDPRSEVTTLVAPGNTVNFYAQWLEAPFDVTDPYFGADGTDQEPDRKAIQKALNCAKNVIGGIEVHIPAGTYLLDGPLQVYSDTTLILQDDTVLRMAVEGETMLLNGNLNAAAIPGGYDRSANIIIKGGTWDGAASGSTPATLIYFCHAKNIHLSGMTLKNCCGNHFIEYAAVADSSVRNCVIRDFVRYSGVNYSDLDTEEGAGGEASRTSEAIQLDFALESSGNAQPYDGTACSGIEISGCSFINCLSGIGNHHDEKTSSGITVKNNTFTGMINTCLNLYNMKKVTADGNKAENVRRFAFAKGTDEITVSNNTISESASSVYAVDLSGAGSVKVTGNTLKGFMTPIIAQDTKVEISGNEISNASKMGIRVMSGSEGKVLSNIINNCGERGISVSESTLSIEENTIKNVTECGIWAYDKGTVSLIKNKIDAECPIAVNFGDCKGDIRENELLHSTEYNLRTYGECEGTISGNVYDIPYGIVNFGGMTRPANGNTYTGADKEPTWFTIYYHADDNAPAAEKSTDIEYDVNTPTLTAEELGIQKPGSVFLGWKAYRRDIKMWRVTVKDEAGNEVDQWAETLPEGAEYSVYGNGWLLKTTAPAGAVVDFYGLWEAYDLFLPLNVHYVMAGAFEGCAAAKIYVPKDCWVIQAKAFANCKNLTKIRLPKNCEIDASAFEGCAKLSVIQAPAGGTVQQWAEDNGYAFVAE